MILQLPEVPGHFRRIYEFFLGVTVHLTDLRKSYVICNPQCGYGMYPGPFCILWESISHSKVSVRPFATPIHIWFAGTASGSTSVRYRSVREALCYPHCCIRTGFVPLAISQQRYDCCNLVAFQCRPSPPGDRY
jgi:hypothetical protein